MYSKYVLYISYINACMYVYTYEWMITSGRSSIFDTRVTTGSLKEYFFLTDGAMLEFKASPSPPSMDCFRRIPCGGDECFTLWLDPLNWRILSELERLLLLYVVVGFWLTFLSCDSELAWDSTESYEPDCCRLKESSLLSEKKLRWYCRCCFLFRFFPQDLSIFMMSR